MKTKDNKYDEYMEQDCVAICNMLNLLPKLRTFESCCGHLKEPFRVWFFCDSMDTISRLGRLVSRNYSDGKWELIIDTTDTHPRGVFCLQSKKPFKTEEEMDASLSRLIEDIPIWFSRRYNTYFSRRKNK